MLILLDIDGVMVPASGWKAPELLDDGFPDFSAKATKALNKIIAATNAAIVLTSSHKSRYSDELWKQMFAKRGIAAVISKLDSANELRGRKTEILHWFNSCKQQQSFVIIDDDKSLNDLPLHLKNRLLLTSSLISLNHELADIAIEILHRPLLARA